MDGYNLNATARFLSADVVREHLHYDPETGAFTWRTSRHGARWPAGRPAGYVSKDYLRIKLFQIKVAASRFAWVYMTGEWPEALVDHWDNDKLNNRWSNLRLATPSQNAMNSSRKREHLKGVCQNTDRPGWSAYICKDGFQQNLGSYPSEREAHEVYKRTAVQLFGEWARFE